MVFSLGLFGPKQGQDFKPAVARLYQNIGRVAPEFSLGRTQYYWRY